MRAYAALEIAPPATAEERKAGIKPATLRKTLEKVEKQTGIRDGRLDAVHVPAGLEYLWAAFWEVYGGATEGMGGIRITWRDLADYERVTGIGFDAFETEAIMAMDGALRAAFAERSDDGG